MHRGRRRCSRTGSGTRRPRAAAPRRCARQAVIEEQAGVEVVARGSPAELQPGLLDDVELAPRRALARTGSPPLLPPARAQVDAVERHAGDLRQHGQRLLAPAPRGRRIDASTARRIPAHTASAGAAAGIRRRDRRRRNIRACRRRRAASSSTSRAAPACPAAAGSCAGGWRTSARPALRQRRVVDARRPRPAPRAAAGIRPRSKRSSRHSMAPFHRSCDALSFAAQQLRERGRAGEHRRLPAGEMLAQRLAECAMRVARRVCRRRMRSP